MINLPSPEESASHTHPQLYDWTELKDKKPSVYTLVAKPIQEAIKQIKQERPKAHKLLEERYSTCIFNDIILTALSERELPVFTAWSEDTGAGSKKVMHEHGVALVVQKQENGLSQAISIEVSAAQFAPVNPEVAQKDTLVVIVPNEKPAIISTLQAIYGGGE